MFYKVKQMYQITGAIVVTMDELVGEEEVKITIPIIEIKMLKAILQ